jgi:hypothetical protein
MVLTVASVLLLAVAMMVDARTSGVNVRPRLVTHLISASALVVYGLGGAAIALAVLERKSRVGQWALASSLFLVAFMIAAYVYGVWLTDQRYAARLRNRSRAVAAPATAPR